MDHVGILYRISGDDDEIEGSLPSDEELDNLLKRLKGEDFVVRTDENSNPGDYMIYESGYNPENYKHQPIAKISGNLILTYINYHSQQNPETFKECKRLEDFLLELVFPQDNLPF